MKKYFLFVLFNIAVAVVFAQQNPVAKKINKSQVPAAVVQSYLSQNSNGTNDTIWEQDFIAVYKVKYVDENRVYESQFSNDGKWIRTFTVISTDELPLLVVNQIRTSYQGYEITKSMIELSNNGKLYAVDLQRGKSTVTEYFLMNGKAFK